MKPDLVVFVLGLGLFGTGLSLAWLPLGPIGVGVVLMGISLFGTPLGRTLR